MKILLAEDEKELSNALVAIMKHNNYSIDAVYDGQDAYDYIVAGDYDLIILDIMMPKMNGLEVLKKIRGEHISTPVLMLTAKAEVEDKIAGLDLGADDYLGKPFAMGELLARIRAMGRRKEEYVPDAIKVGNVTLNQTSYELFTEASSERIRLGNKEYQLMEMLMRAPNRIFSTDQIMEKIWGFDSEAEINVVWVNISYLRKKLASMNADIEIKAVRGVGYTLVINQ